jgi:hypothetical protein
MGSIRVTSILIRLLAILASPLMVSGGPLAFDLIKSENVVPRQIGPRQPRPVNFRREYFDFMDLGGCCFSPWVLRSKLVMPDLYQISVADHGQTSQSSWARRQ